MARILVAMSGGVDSSVAAALLKEEGHEVIGGFMQTFDYSQKCESSFGSCCSPEDCADARRVAEQIGIPFYTFNMEEVFKEKVIDYFIDEYLSGRTPNPCIYCNSTLK
ncbi:MAG: 7-cyano-7-deazaguanine synthase, partial [Nitrospinae bacterium]|nr:7-cyano-7-deazaguanine synthase [Nitrospinota bacterium]